jgi:hypothetical protein
MATIAHNTPTFSRIISKGRPTSWALGVPVVFVLVVLLALFAYFASRASSFSQQLDGARLELVNNQKITNVAQRALTQAQSDLGIAKSPGRTTLTLQSSDKAATAWASAVWGENAGNAFVLLRAYGLKTPATGQAYQVWYEGTAGKPQLIGVLDPGPTGSAYVAGKDLPAMNQSKRLFVVLGAEDAKEVKAGAIPLLETKLELPKQPVAAEPVAKPE